MTRHEKPTIVLPPRHAQGRRRARRLDRGPDHARASSADGTTAAAAKPALTPDQLSSYIAVNADGSVNVYFGKMDMGQGLDVAIRQMVAEELNVPFASTRIFIGDTDTSVNQGGASGSTGVQEGGKQMRMAAAEAKRVLVEMASDKLGVPADQLTVTDGVVHAASDATKTSATPN